MTMQEASQELKKLLRGIYDPRESSNIAEWVMEDLTGINHIDRIMHSHRIYVLEKGYVVETGTHESLVEEKGLYYAMWRQQIGERKKLSSTAGLS